MTNWKWIQHKEELYPLLLGIAFFIYLVLRVWIMPISDDEYITIDLHASQSWLDILLTRQPQLDWAPNNHVLNTLLMKLEILLFGRKDWAVRLHILAAFVICYYYAVRIMARITTSTLRQVLFLVILFFNPYLLDFFGLARGYAISMAGFTAAFYYYLVYLESHTLKDLRWIMLALFLATWGNFSTLYFVALLDMLLFFDIYKNRSRLEIRQPLITIIVANLMLLVIILFPLISTLSSSDTFGGKTGLYQDCIVNYVNQFIHHNIHLNRHAVFAPGWKYIEVVAIIFLALWLILQLTSFLYKTTSRLSKMHFDTLYLIAGAAIISKIMFIFFGTPYPTARTELLYSFPFYFSFCIAFERIISVNKWGYVPLGLIIAGLVWHFSSSVTFENTIEWWQNGDAKRVVHYLEKEFRKNKPDHELNMGAESWQYHSLAFYTEVELKDVVKLHWTDLSTDEHYDYLFVPFDKSDKVWPEYEPVQKFRHGILYKLKN